MKNAFETLGLPPRLVIDGDALNAAFREACKAVHPDAGGGEHEFAGLREAYEVMMSPSRRLKHWLEIRGVALETRGIVDPALMDLFTKVGAATQRAEALVRKRGETRSALGLALLEREAHDCREAVERALAQVDAAITGECSWFPMWDESGAADPALASKTARNLAFLEKWRAGLRGVFSRMI